MRLNECVAFLPPKYMTLLTAAVVDCCWYVVVLAVVALTVRMLPDWEMFERAELKVKND